MSWHLGIDTSNYTTSAAAWNPDTGQMLQSKKKLPVKEGELGLRQSDAVFAHVTQLGSVTQQLTRQVGTLASVGVSVKPRDVAGSYMPCFLTGKMAAEVVAATHHIPLTTYSHQAGHIAAVLFATDNLSLVGKEFIAFHLSGGTTECVLVTPGEDIPFQITPLYQSLDLYAGQAIDRIGAKLGLEFPAGPALEALALKSKKKFRAKPYFRQGNPSISGLENQCDNRLEKGESREDIAKYVLDWLIQMLATMTENGLALHPGLPVIYSGGVMSNSLIRQSITQRYGGHFAPPEYSADNAAGIAVLAGIDWKEKNK